MVADEHLCRRQNLFQTSNQNFSQRLSTVKTNTICNIIPGATPSPPPPRESPQQHLLVQARQGKRSPSPGRAGCCARSRTLCYKLRLALSNLFCNNKKCQYAHQSLRRSTEGLRLSPNSSILTSTSTSASCHVSAILPDTAFDLYFNTKKEEDEKTSLYPRRAPRALQSFPSSPPSSSLATLISGQWSSS